MQKSISTQALINFMLYLFFRYADKFTEFLHSFVQSHLRRFENSHHFPVNEFLSLLFKYTFGQDRSEAYMACLDVSIHPPRISPKKMSQIQIFPMRYLPFVFEGLDVVR